MEDIIEKYKKIQMLNRLRQQRFYEKNKVKILERNRAEYIKKYKYSKPIETVDEKVDDINLNNLKTLSMDQTIHFLKQLVPIKTTLTKYLGDLKRLSSIIDNRNIIVSLTKYKTVINSIRNFKKDDNINYSTNTKKSMIQLILFLIDKLHLNIPTKIKDEYVKVFEEYKINTNDENLENQSSTEILSFKDYLKQVKEKFGPISKMYVLASLYNFLTVRDNYILKIVNNINDTYDYGNFVIVDDKKPIKIIIQKYKTSEKFGPIKANLPLALSNLIKEYIKENNLHLGDYLFGDKNLSSFISINNKKMNIKDGINGFRHMKISEFLDKLPSAAEKVDFAKKMTHSPLVQQQYYRKKKFIID